jgi:hypothetical protein
MLNMLFISSTSTILSHLHMLLFGKGVFEGVTGNPQMQIVLCHWVGDLAHEIDTSLAAVLAVSLVHFVSEGNEI